MKGEFGQTDASGMFFLQTACNDNSDSCKKKFLIPTEVIGSQKYIDLESSDILKVTLFRDVPTFMVAAKENYREVYVMSSLYFPFSGVAAFCRDITSLWGS